MIKPLTAESVWTEDFFSLLGLDTISAEDKDAILQKMNETVQANVYLEIYGQLSDEDRHKLDSISSDEILVFLKGKGFDMPQMVLDEALRYRLKVANLFRMATTPGQQLAS